MLVHLFLLLGLAGLCQIVVSTNSLLHVDAYATKAKVKTEKLNLELKDIEHNARKMQSKKPTEVVEENVGDDDSTRFKTDDVTIDDDSANSKSSGSTVQVFSSDTRMFLSAQTQSLTVLGKGFSSDLFLDLHPPLQVDVDYKLTVVSTTTATLTLLPGKQWRTKPGLLVARGAFNAGQYHKLGKKGQRLVTVLADIAKQPTARAPPHTYLRSVPNQTEKTVSGL